MLVSVCGKMLFAGFVSDCTFTMGIVSFLGHPATTCMIGTDTICMADTAASVELM